MIGPWRLEWLRIWRTRRLIALVATFLILGFGSPVLTYYLPDLIKHSSSSGIEITIPEQTAVDGIASYAGNIAQLGTLVIVVVAAATLALDARPGLAAFYRTRIQRRTMLVLPRFLVITAAAIAALALGTIGAWYETTILLGTVPVAALLKGFALEAIWIVFVCSMALLFSGLVRGVLGVVGATLGLLLGLALLGSFSFAASWSPTRLSGSMADFMRESPGDHWQAITVTLAVSVAACAIAVILFDRREPISGSSARP